MKGGETLRFLCSRVGVALNGLNLANSFAVDGGLVAFPNLSKDAPRLIASGDNLLNNVDFFSGSKKNSRSFFFFLPTFLFFLGGSGDIPRIGDVIALSPKNPRDRVRGCRDTDVVVIGTVVVDCRVIALGCCLDPVMGVVNEAKDKLALGLSEFLLEVSGEEITSVDNLGRT